MNTSNKEKVGYFLERLSLCLGQLTAVSLFLPDVILKYVFSFWSASWLLEAVWSGRILKPHFSRKYLAIYALCVYFLLMFLSMWLFTENQGYAMHQIERRLAFPIVAVMACFGFSANSSLNAYLKAFLLGSVIGLLGSMLVPAFSFFTDTEFHRLVLEDRGEIRLYLQQQGYHPTFSGILQLTALLAAWRFRHLFCIRMGRTPFYTGFASYGMLVVLWMWLTGSRICLLLSVMLPLAVLTSKLWKMGRTVDIRKALGQAFAASGVFALVLFGAGFFRQQGKDAFIPVEVTLEGENSGLLQFFYTQRHWETFTAQKNVSAFMVPDCDTYRFRIPAARICRLRLDFETPSDSLAISEILVKGIRYSGEFTTNHCTLSSVDGQTVLKAEGNDPFVVCQNPLNVRADFQGINLNKLKHSLISALAAFVVLSLLFWPLARHGRLITVLPGLVCVLTVLAVYLYHPRFEPLRPNHWHDVSILREEGRLNTWSSAVALLSEDNGWLLGIGVGDTRDKLEESFVGKDLSPKFLENTHHCHSNFLNSMLEMGLPGLLLLLFTLIWPLTQVKGTENKTFVWSALFCQFVLMAVDTTFSLVRGIVPFALLLLFIVSLNDCYDE